MAASVLSGLRFGRGAAPPLVVWAPACAAAALGVIPPVYLLVRALEGGPALLALLSHPRTLELLVNSTGLAVAVTAACVALSVPVAWLTTCTDLGGTRVWATLTALPLVIPTFVGGFVFVAAFGPGGLLAAPLTGLRLPLPSIYGFGGAWLALTLFVYPYVLLPVRAALRGLDPSLEEAARSLGRGPWATFWGVTLPQLRPAIAGGGLLVALYTLSEFGIVSLLRFDTFTRAIYLQYQASFDRTLAAGLSLVLIALTVVVLAAEVRVRGPARYYRSTGGAVRRRALVRLGRWRWPARLALGGLVLVATVLPLAVLVAWLVRGSGQEVALRQGFAATANSLLAGGLTAAVAGALSLPLSVLVVRHPGRLARSVERAVYAGFALPGITVALALVFFGARLATPLYQTLALLVIAYMIRFLPEAVSATRASLLQLNPRIEEAARNLGRRPHQVLVEVTAPLVLPGLASGMALVLLTTLKELPITLLLAPTGFRTLATAIWTGATEGLFAEAALASLVLIAVTSVPLLLLSPEEAAEA